MVGGLSVASIKHFREMRNEKIECQIGTIWSTELPSGLVPFPKAKIQEHVNVSLFRTMVLSLSLYIGDMSKSSVARLSRSAPQVIVILSGPLKNEIRQETHV